MKKSGILNNRLSEVIASMGHYQKLVICDAGFPIPQAANRIDLSVVRGIPAFMDVLRAVLDELQIETAYIASETEVVSPKRYQEILERLPKEAKVRFIPQSELLEHSQHAMAFVRTGECVPYSNIILESGVVWEYKIKEAD